MIIEIIIFLFLFILQRTRRAIVNWELLFKGLVTQRLQREREKALANDATEYVVMENDRDLENRISSLQVFDRLEARATYRLRRARNRLQIIEEERRRNMEKVMDAARLLVNPADVGKYERPQSRPQSRAASRAGNPYGSSDDDGFSTVRVGGGGGGGGSSGAEERDGSPLRPRPHSAAAVITRHGIPPAGPSSKKRVLHQARLSSTGVSFSQKPAGRFPTPDPLDAPTPMPPVHPRPQTAPDRGFGKDAGSRVPKLALDPSSQAELNQSLAFDGYSQPNGNYDVDLLRIQSMSSRYGRREPSPPGARITVKTPMTERLKRSQSPAKHDRSMYLPRADLKVNFTNLTQAERREMILNMIYRDSRLSQLRKRAKNVDGSAADISGDEASASGVDRAVSPTRSQSTRGLPPANTAHPFGGRATPVLITKLGKGGPPPAANAPEQQRFPSGKVKRTSSSKQ